MTEQSISEQSKGSAKARLQVGVRCWCRCRQPARGASAGGHEVPPLECPSRAAAAAAGAPGLALGAAGREHSPPAQRQAQPWAGSSPCHALGATTRGVHIPARLCSVPVGCSPSPATAAGWLPPRSSQGHGRRQAPRGQSRVSVAGGTARCQAGVGAAGTESSGLQARVTALPVPVPVPQGGSAAGPRGTCRAKPSPMSAATPEGALVPLWDTQTPWLQPHLALTPLCNT